MRFAIARGLMETAALTLRALSFMDNSPSEVKSIMDSSELDSTGSCLILLIGRSGFPGAAFGPVFLLRLGLVEGFRPSCDILV